MPFGHRVVVLTVRVGPEPLLALQRLVVDATLAEHRDTPPGVQVDGALRVGAIGGNVTRMSETKANREEFGIRLPRIGDFAPDGSYPAHLRGGGVTLTVRVIEYHVTLAGTTTAESFCLITDLHDHLEHPAGALAAAYRWRWDGSETALREAKSTLHGAGAVLHSHSPAPVRQEHVAWITAGGLLHALTRSAAATASPLSKGPRAGRSVDARDLSFTAARRAAITTTLTGTLVAGLGTPDRADTPGTVLEGIAAGRGTTDRHHLHRPSCDPRLRHSPGPHRHGHRPTTGHPTSTPAHTITEYAA